MKIFWILPMLVGASTHLREAERRDTVMDCSPDYPCEPCEPRDCDTDADCMPGLLCADAHKAELGDLGFDERKAYCDPTLGEPNWELCYDPALAKLGECEFDCDTDDDCGPDLACADVHKDYLEDVGLDPRKAYCGDVGDSNLEVCYSPSAINCTVPVPDFFCGVLSPGFCGTSGPFGRCVCDVNVEGDPFCWENFACGSTNACTDTSDCEEGYACLTSCCGQTCAPACGTNQGLARRLREGEAVLTGIGYI